MRFFLIFKIVLFTVLVPGTVIGYIPYTMVSGFDGKLQVAPVVLALPAAMGIIIGMLMFLRCTFDFAVSGLGTPAPIDPPKKLVVTGLYRWNRNPMYQGMLLILVSESLLFLNFNLLVYAGFFALVFHGFVVFFEEPVLLDKFGASYEEYCRQIPRWGFRFQP